jgi:hypothetical protein
LDGALFLGELLPRYDADIDMAVLILYLIRAHSSELQNDEVE